MKHQAMPVAMGLIMGPIMLWMLHGMVTGGGPLGLALLVFIGAHVLIVAVVLVATVFAARLSPGLRARLDRMHRPSLRHVGVMLGSAAFAALIVHLFIHGAI